MQDLRAYGICRSCFEPYLSHRGCPRCDHDADARVAPIERAGVLPLDLELERQAPELHRLMPRTVFAVVGAALVVLALIAAAMQAA